MSDEELFAFLEKRKKNRKRVSKNVANHHRRMKAISGDS